MLGPFSSWSALAIRLKAMAEQHQEGQQFEHVAAGQEDINDSSWPADACPWRRPVLTCGLLVTRPFQLPKAGWCGAANLETRRHRGLTSEAKLSAF